jgi:LmbE family N-acetylglucosaminyl deacetylase
MPNMLCHPEQPTWDDEIAIYHAQPHGNRDPLGQLVHPSIFVDVGELIDRKRELLAIHASQDKWLESTQGISAFLETMVELNREVGRMSARTASLQHRLPFQFAEGWRKHLHWGFSQADFDPLSDALRDCILKEY